MKPTKLSAALLLLLTITSSTRAQDTVNRETHFSRAQLGADVNYLTSVISRVHPNMYHHINQQQYRKLTDSVLGQLREQMTEREAWPLLARLVGALGEGHSTFDFPPGIIDRMKNGGRLLFPVSISRFDGMNLVVGLDRSNDYGELIFLKLPNTGLSFATCTKQFVRANGDAKDQHPVLPNYFMVDELATPQDEVLDFVKKL